MAFLKIGRASGDAERVIEVSPMRGFSARVFQSADLVSLGQCEGYDEDCEPDISRLTSDSCSNEALLISVLFW